jgi:hypothetical protein
VPFYSALERLLHHRRFFWAVVCVGTLLAVPSLGAGFVADDFIFINRLDRSAGGASWSLYEFATGEPGQHARLMNSRWVAFPWWMAADFKVRFLRPLSSALFALDHSGFGLLPLGYHAHCLLWYALLLVAVGLLLRSICGAPIWQMAFSLFAVSASHAEAVAWISSRHMLVSTVPALFGLVALVHYRERGFRPGLLLGLLGMAVGLLGGEAALSVACYWLAYEAFAPHRGTTLAARARRLAVPLVTIGAYAGLYKHLGYGAAASAAYLDPLSTPRAFVSVLPARLAMLAAEIFAGVPSGLAATTMPRPAVAVGALLTVAVLRRLSSIWPAIPGGERRALPWLASGALLALLVNAGAFLGPRLVLIPGIGAFVVIAIVLRHGWPSGAKGASRFDVVVGRGVCALFVLVHVLLAPLGFIANCYLLGKLGAAASEMDTALDGQFETMRVRAGRPASVFILAASDPFSGFYAAAARAARVPNSTAQWTILSMARATHAIERTAPNELTIHSDPSMLRSSFEGLFRAYDRPFSPGDRAAVASGFVTVLTVEGGRPTSISLTLSNGTFDDPSVCLLAWRDQRLSTVQLALHERITIPWTPGPTGLL